jgi:hypothetical protein
MCMLQVMHQIPRWYWCYSYVCCTSCSVACGWLAVAFTEAVTAFCYKVAIPASVSLLWRWFLPELSIEMALNFITVWFLKWRNTFSMLGEKGIQSCFIPYAVQWNARWSKDHATPVKIFVDGCNLVWLNLINKLIVQEPMQVMSCCNLLMSVCRSSFTSSLQGCLFSHAYWVFFEHCLAYCSYLILSLRIHFTIFLCQTDWQYLVWWTVSITVEILHRLPSYIWKRMNACITEHGGYFWHLT